MMTRDESLEPDSMPGINKTETSWGSVCNWDIGKMMGSFVHSFRKDESKDESTVNGEIEKERVGVGK